VAEYYLRTYGAPSSSFNWAIAGRNQNKLQEIKKDLSTNKNLPEAKDIKTLVANSDDSASLEAIAKNTKVVVTTVGPYMKYGSKLVAACAAKGTHYADLTGEVREGGRKGGRERRVCEPRRTCLRISGGICSCNRLLSN